MSIHDRIHALIDDRDDLRIASAFEHLGGDGQIQKPQS